MTPLYLLLLAAAASAKNVVKLDIKGTRAAEHPLGRYNELVNRMIAKRDNDFTVELDNLVSFYQIDIEIGTPPQSVGLLIDTGSSDLWAISTDNEFCQDESNECEGGAFDPSSSKTFSKNDTDFMIVYGDSTQASGFFGTDDIKLSDSVTVSKATLGIGSDSNSTTGVFGIGYSGLESSQVGQLVADGDEPVAYQNVPELLKAQGFIERVSYSLYLDSLEDSTGSLLFGAVDHDKYKGDLGLMPVINTELELPETIQLQVVLSSISLQNGNGDSQTIQSGNVAALLDSGTTVSLLPSATVNAIGQALGATLSRSSGFWTLSSCDDAPNGSLDFDFNGVTISVPYSELLLQNGRQCILGLEGVGSDLSSIILGDTFLRSAYVVYDLENNQIAMANTNFDSSDSDIEVLSAGSGIPSASSVSDYSSTTLARSVSVSTVGTAFVATATGTSGDAATSAETDRPSTSGRIRTVSDSDLGDSSVTSAPTSTSSRASSSSARSTSSSSPSASSSADKDNAGAMNKPLPMAPLLGLAMAFLAGMLLL